jgi:hypothetical protein
MPALTNVADELVVASNGQVYVAPLGTTLPAYNTDPTASLNAAFGALGYVTEDGVTITATPDITEFRAWQSEQAVRRDRKSLDMQYAFALEQWSRKAVITAFGGGEITSAGGFYTYVLPTSADPLEELSLIIDWQDGDKNYRWVHQRGNVTDAVETKLKADELSLLPITFKGLDALDGAAPYLITDDPAFADGS